MDQPCDHMNTDALPTFGQTSSEQAVHNESRNDQHHGYHNISDTATNDEIDNNVQAQVYDPRWDDHSVDEVETYHELQYEPQTQHEIYALSRESGQLQPSPFEGKSLPNIIVSLAQQVLPIVLNRLHRHDDCVHTREYVRANDHFEGLCAPLGNTSELNSSEAIVNTNLKTTGLEDEQYDTTFKTKQEYSIQHDLEIGDLTECLPESAALLISVFNNSTKNEDSTCWTTKLVQGLPSCLDEALESGNDESHRLNVPFHDMDQFEQEAEALLQSIRNDDTKSNVAHLDPSSDNQIPSSFDDDDSIGGDMIRLSHSIAYLQQDLNNLDMSYLDGIYQEDGIDRFDGEGSAWSRMKLWFSRGMILEQKLLNTFNVLDNDHDGANIDTATRNRYADNPVLIWSLAIMWAFILLCVTPR